MEFTIESLVNSLKVNVSSNSELKSNTEYLSKCKSQPNFATYLLKITCCNEDYPQAQEIKLNAAIQLQNFIRLNWRFTNDKEKNKAIIWSETEMIIISNEEKDFICKNILDGIQYSISVNNMKIVKQLNQCVKKILYYNYESNWKEFFTLKVLECLKSNNQKDVYTGIILFHQLSKIYQYEHDEKKKIYNAQFTLVNDHFLSILSQCTNPNDATQGIFIKKIFKIYSKNFMCSYLSPTVGNVDYLEKWVEYIIYIIQFPIDSTQCQEKQNTFWKLKLVSYDLIEIIYKKHCSCSLHKNKILKDYEKYLYQKFTLRFFNTIKIIYTNTTESSKYIDEKCLCVIYKLFTAMINYKHYINEVFEIFMGEHKIKIVNDSILTSKDIDIWINEPKEHINNFMNIAMNYNTIRYATFQLIYAMMQFNPKEEQNPMMSILYEFFIKVLQSNQSEVNKEIEAIKANTEITDENINIFIQKNPNCIKHNLLKESVLYIMRSVHSVIRQKLPGSIDKLIEIFVLPELDSPIGLLRESGCNFIESFREHTINSDQLKVMITKKLCGLLVKEKMLTVRFMCSMALPVMLKYSNIRILLKGNIQILLVIYLKLINEIEISEVIECLQEIFKYFKKEVREYIPNLCDCLIKNFLKITNKLNQDANDNNNEDIDDNFDSITVSNQIIETFSDIIRIYSNDKEIFTKIEIYINIILVYCLRNDTEQNFENGLDIIMECLTNSTIIPKSLWVYFNNLIEAVIGNDEERQTFAQKQLEGTLYEGDQWDSTNQISKVICYYIVKDSNTFLTGVDSMNKSYLTKTFDFIKNVIDLSIAKKTFFKIKGALEILRILLESYRGKIDDIFNVILDIIIKHFDISSNARFKLFFCDLFSSCLLYNPILCLKYLEANNALEGLINFWLINLTLTDIKQEIKHDIMGLCALVSIYPMISNQFPLNLLKTILSQLMVLITKRANLKALQAKEDNEIEQKTSQLNIEDNDKAVDLNKKVDQILDDDDDLLENEQEEEEEEDEDDWFSDDEIITMIDKQNEIICIKDMLTMMSSKYNTFFEHIQTLLGNDKMMLLQNVIIEEEKQIEEKNNKKNKK